MFSEITLFLETPCMSVHTAHNGSHSPSGKFWLKFIFSAHMNAMELLFSGGLQEMCMFHEPKGFWPTIFLQKFSGALKSHYPVSRPAPTGSTSAVKVNWSTFNFNTTSREHTNRRNAPFCRKSLPKSEKKSMFLRLRLATIHSWNT